MAAPRRGGSNCWAAPCRRMALQYSIPKMLLGVCSKSAAPGHNVSAAAARAAAKGRPLSSWLRSAAGNAALHSAAATSCKGAGSGVSAPNARVSHPSAASRCTRQRQTVLRWRWHRAQAAPPPGPPRQPALRAPAQLPAGWVPHRAAQRRCSCTPRWYWPPAARSMRSCNAWPLWNGSYSAMMPTKFISSTPDSSQILFACAEKSLAMFSASLYNKFV